MRLSEKTLTKIAEMICGSNGTMGGFHWENFTYRSSSYLSEFFVNAGLPHRHLGNGTRKFWVLEQLQKENATATSNPKLPSDSMIVILQTLLDGRTFEENKKDRTAAINDLNGVLKWDGLRIVVDSGGLAQIEAIDGATSSVGSLFQVRRAWTEEEQKTKQSFVDFLNRASEDEITEKMLVPLFLHLGFKRISVAGHKDKRLEYGTDVWMKFTLPTAHALYFGCQIKKEKIDASGKSDVNVATILNQIGMMLDYPVWDPESNRKQLLDHVYIISGGEITKQAKNWLGERLDASKRRQIMFMDRAELLDLVVANRIAVPRPPQIAIDEDVPF